ncbi:hypothetical protein AcV5_004968 [Taiwanofungus camphoratus]|nr:hypothetical protein AcV5_004968 [Antrodia cinnamomea]
MSKREASRIAAAGIDIDAPRAKRRREAPAETASSPPKEQVNATHTSAAIKNEAEGEESQREDRDAVREKGTKLWQTVKDAVNKEGRILSHDFMRLPSRRQYPDYYQQIKRPIALDEIKAQLDAGAYASLESVKVDFETCFRNAKRYNIKESQIWKDAKYLHKLVVKEYNKMTGANDDVTGEVAEEGEDINGPAAAGPSGLSEDEGGKKKKTPNMTRLLKSRLQKLVEKTDDSGRVLSTEFMDLPNRKQWPIYYKAIKRPQCLENIFKRLKRKEYHASPDFANDVELVFSNALEFNQEHTGIWEDAVVLRDYFRQLMSDLPPPYSIPAYTTAESQTKLKLKVPAAPSNQTASQPLTHLTSSPPNNATSSGTEAARSPVITPKIAPASPHAHSATPVPTVQPSPSPTLTIPQLKTSPSTSTGTLQPATFAQSSYPSAYSQHYPNATYQQHSVAPPVPSTSTSSPSAQNVSTAPQTAVAPTSRVSPMSSAQNHRRLKSILLTTKPLGRRLDLDDSDGVKSWAVRLNGESGVRVSGVKFRGHKEEDEESSEDEGKGRKDLEQEEEEEEDEETAKEEIKVKRGRGRPRKNVKATENQKPSTEHTKSKNKGKAPSKPLPAHEELQVKLNDVLVKENEERTGEWDLELPIGSNILEVGEKGSVPWKIYLQKVAS